MAHGTHTNSDQPTLMISVAIAIVVAAAVIWGFVSTVEPVKPTSEASFTFEPLKIDDARLKAERAALLKGHDLSKAQKEIAALHAVIREANALQFQQGNGQSTRRAEAKVDFASNDVLTVTGSLDVFVETGADLYHACQNEVAKVLTDIQAGKVTLEAMKTTPPQQYGPYTEACGNVLSLLEERSLITSDGKWTHPENGPAILEILSRLRYAFIIGVRRQAMTQLTPYERQILMRWRIEDPAAYPYNERLAFLSRTTDKELGYPTLVARAKLAYESGNKPAARLKYEEACAANKKDYQLQAQCEWLRKNVELPEHLKPKEEQAPAH